MDCVNLCLSKTFGHVNTEWSPSCSDGSESSPPAKSVSPWKRETPTMKDLESELLFRRQQQRLAAYKAHFEYEAAQKQMLKKQQQEFMAQRCQSLASSKQTPS